MRNSLSLILVGALACSFGACSSDNDRPAHGGWAASSGGTYLPAATAGVAQVDPSGGETATAGAGGQAGSAGDTGGEAGAPDASGGSSEGGMGGQPEDPKPISGDCLADPLSAPSLGQCVPVGDPGYDCNPVTGAPCDTLSGKTCEFNGAGFACQDLPAEKTSPCRPCDSSLAASCVVGFTCRGTVERCTRYCCDDGDCGTGATCVKQLPSVLGICQATSERRLQDFGWDLPDAGSDAGSDAAPPVDCPSCAAQLCADRDQSCRSDPACLACLASNPPADTCYGLFAWQMLTNCRCSQCAELCPGACD